MSYYKLFIIPLFFLFSCSSKEIPERELPQIISEIYKVDRHIGLNYNLAVKSDTTKIYESVLGHYGYTNEQFVKSIERYLHRPEKLKRIYIKAAEIVDKEREEIAEFLERQYQQELFSYRYRELSRDSTTLSFKKAKERAYKWISAPTLYPKWRVTMNDSLLNLYQVPTMPTWWIDNFKPDTTTIYFISRAHEKNFGTLSHTRK